MGADLLSETLSRLSELQPKPQTDALASFSPILKREDGLIDWTMNSVEISDRVRGFQPFPTSFTYLNGSRLTVRWAVPATPADDSVPGRIAAATGEELIVECGAGSALRITEIQMEGKRKMATRDFVNGHKPQIGTILGN
jgi:methionyl-tRNA formyltransferase